MRNTKIIIFCFYIIFLALLPCTDESSHNVCQTEGITHAEDTHTAEGHGDNCSPLCNCMCCNEIVSVSKDASINRTNQITSFSGSYIPEIPPVKIKPGLRPPRS